MTLTDCALCKACVEDKETVNHQASLIANDQLHIFCQDTKILIVCFIIPGVFRKIFSNLTSRLNNTTNTPEVLMLREHFQTCYTLIFLQYVSVNQQRNRHQEAESFLS